MIYFIYFFIIIIIIIIIVIIINSNDDLLIIAIFLLVMEAMTVLGFEEYMVAVYAYSAFLYRYNYFVIDFDSDLSTKVSGKVSIRH